MAYANSLRNLLENPGSFSGSPGYGFARDQALQATSRSAAAGGMRGSGNVLAALQDRASGLASQDYGNQVDRMQRATTGEQQYELGRGALDNSRHQGDQQFGLGMYRAGNDFTLGTQQNQNTANNNWWNYNNNMDTNDVNRFDAQTRRGSAQSAANRNWWQ